jgi:hypothetical protein
VKGTQTNRNRISATWPEKKRNKLSLCIFILKEPLCQSFKHGKEEEENKLGLSSAKLILSCAFLLARLDAGVTPLGLMIVEKD